MKRFRFLGLSVFGAVMVLGVVGCDGGMVSTKGRSPTAARQVPSPINLLLPKAMNIHPFTQAATFSPGNSGIHARIQARDAYGDPTKAFGDFRFELYNFRPYHQEKKGAKIAGWEVSISDPKQNLTHWDRHTRSYEFKLGGQRELPTGTKVVLVVIFSSRFTPRITAEREITAGE